MDRPLPARCTTTNSRTRQRKTKTATILSPRLPTRSRTSKVVAAKSTASNKRKIGSSGGCGAKIRKTLQGSDVAGETSPIPRSDFHSMFELMQDLAKQVSRTHVLVAALFCDDGNVVQESVKQIKSSIGNDEAAGSVVARIPNEVASTELECNGTTVASSVIARTPHQEASATKLHETISSQADGSGQKPAKSTKRRAKEPTQKIAKNKPAKQKRATRKSPKFVDPTSVPLTHEEKEKVVEAINSMSSQETQSIVQLIRESAKIDGNDDEIELEIDALDTATQRQLLWFVSSRRKKPKKGKTQQRNTKGSDKNSNRVPSDEEVPKSRCGQMAATAKDLASASASCAPETNIISNNPKPFTFAVFKMLENDDSDEDENMLDDSKWNLSSTKNNVDVRGAKVQAGHQHHYDDEDEWDAARNEAALAQIRQAQQEAYKAKLEQTQKQKQRASASAFRQQCKAIDNDIYQEKQKKAEAEAARAATREQVNAVQQTIDLDEQRDIMRELGLYRDGISVGSSDFEYKF